MNWIGKFLSKLLEWIFRRRSPALAFMRVGLVCLAVASGLSWQFHISFPLRGGVFDFNAGNDSGIPVILIYATFVLAFVLIIFGGAWEFVRNRREQKSLASKRTVIVEARGLRDVGGVPLASVVEGLFPGRVEHLLVDLRQRVADGFIVDPEAAISRLASLPNDLERREKAADRHNISCVYGGLAPVPLTFLTGVLMDDEGAVAIMDWDRHEGRWRSLDGLDDGKRFHVRGLNTLQAQTVDVGLAVSVSYGVNLPGVAAKLGEVPIVHLELEGGSPDAHWSEEKQRALGKQFLDTAIRLGNAGVQRIHLFLAAPNSVVFRLGRLYDKRNLPELISYQYQQESAPPFPWGVRMPVAGVKVASVVR